MGHYYLSINYYILLHPEQSQQKVLSRYLTCYHVSPETMNFAGAIVIDQWISIVICRENSNFVHNNSFFSTCFTWSAANHPRDDLTILESLYFRITKTIVELAISLDTIVCKAIVRWVCIWSKSFSFLNEKSHSMRMKNMLKIICFGFGERIRKYIDNNQLCNLKNI